MFTGLVEETAKVLSFLQQSDEITKLTLVKPKNFQLKYGESIAVNGCCLTVTSFDEFQMDFDVNQESIKLTNLKHFEKNTLVNLERAMALGDRLGGHIVTGHIEGTCSIQSISKNSQGDLYIFKIPADFSKYLISKGSITLNGVSLTINKILDFKENGYSEVEVMLIPTTLKDTNLGTSSVGDLINLETDILGKYIERLNFFKS